MHEFRTYEASSIELRGKPGEGAVLAGYPVVYNVRSQLLGGWFVERVEPGAFDESIAGDDIAFKYNHEVLLARSIPSLDHFTSRLTPDEKGVLNEVDLPSTQAARDVYQLVERGDLRGMSFAFRTLGEDYNWWDEDDDGLLVRTIKRGKLYDTSVVDSPAYLDTEIWVERALRSLSMNTNQPLRGLREAAKSGSLPDFIRGKAAGEAPPGEAPAPEPEPCEPPLCAPAARELVAARLRLLDLGIYPTR